MEFNAMKIICPLILLICVITDVKPNEIIVEKYKNLDKDYVKQADGLIKLGEAYVPSDTKIHTKSLPKDNTGEGDHYPNNGCASGRYLCNGTLDICIRFSDICNGKQDCPFADDEDQEVCSKWSNRPKATPIKQILPPLNSVEQTQPLAAPEIAGSQNGPIVVPNINPLIDRLVGKSTPDRTQNFAGSGFMFHVENLVIYNSDVKMFNQNSDNHN